MITLYLNAKLQPMHRHDMEDFIDEHLKKLNLGSVDGGGTALKKNGEIDNCDIGIECTKENRQDVIEFLKTMPLPCGSKIIIDEEEEDNDEIPLGTLQGMGFYFSNDLEEEVYQNYDINVAIEKFDELLEDKYSIFSYCETKQFTAIYYYGDSFIAMADAIVDFTTSYPLCAGGKIVELTAMSGEEEAKEEEVPLKGDSTEKNELYREMERLYDEDKETEAIALYNSAADSLKTPDVKSFLGVGYNNTGQCREAIEILLEVENKTNNELKRLYRLAYAYWRLDESENCMDACQRVFDLAKAEPELDINNYVKDCRLFYSDSQREINGEDLNSGIEGENSNSIALEVYEEDEMEIIENHIAKAFGEFESVFHEIVSPDIHVDICAIKPTEERNYYTLVTMGMGAHSMNVPEELSHRSRAELCIYLPAHWEIHNEEEQWYWPIRWLKILARLPIEHDTWLGHLHTVPSGETLAENTELEGFILEVPNTLSDELSVCQLPNGEIVNFYSIIPIYEAEMSYKLDNGGEALISRLEEEQENIYLVNISRPAVIDLEEAYGATVDVAHSHINAIFDKELELDVLTAYNHLAIYLRWAIENDLMCEEFCEDFPEVINMVKTNVSIEELDLRVFLHKEFNGRMLLYLFNDEGADFTADYYGENGYPMDVDSYAEKYFGGVREEHKDEDYLFVPYDEAYYQGMKEYIDMAYAEYNLMNRADSSKCEIMN